MEEDNNTQEKITSDISLSDIDYNEISALLQKTDRIISENEKVVVTSTDGTELAYADTINLNIFLNYDDMKNQKRINNAFNFVLFSKGLNYHELAHLLFTDYGKNNIQRFVDKKYAENRKDNVKIINVNEFMRNLNLLEDCRIENLFYAQYPRLKHYFSFNSGVVYLDEIPNMFKSGDFSGLLQYYLLIYGRKFFGNKFKDSLVKIRKDITQDITKVKDLVIQCETLMDKFIFEKDMNNRLNIAYEFVKLLNDNNINVKNNSSSLSLLKSKSIRGTKQRNKEMTDKLKQRIDNENNQNKKGSSSSSNNKKKKSEIKSMEDLCKDVMKEIANNDNIKKEINKELGKLNTNDKELYEDGLDVKKRNTIINSTSFNPSSKEVFEIRKLERVLRLLRGDLSSKVERFKKRGKIDILSSIKARQNNNLRIFKKKNRSKIDKAKIGVSILMDTSSSISFSDFNNEIGATYCLVKSLEKLKNKTQVIEFSIDYKIIKNFDTNKGDWKRHYRGGTIILPAFKQSVNDLIKLKRKEKINNLFTFIVSDGEFWESDTSIKKQITKTHKRGIKVIWIFANCREDYNKKLSEEFDWFINIKDLSELSTKFNTIIKDIQKNITTSIITNGDFYS